MKRPFVPIVIAVAAGLTTAHYQIMSFSMGMVVGCAGLLLLCLGTVRAMRLVGTCAALCVFWAAGFLSMQRFIEMPRSQGDIRNFITDSRIIIEGVISQPPARFPDRVRLLVRLAAVHERSRSHAATGMLQLTIASPARTYRYGDRIRCSVVLREPRRFANPGSFDYPRYLAYHGIHATAFLADDRSITMLRRNEGNRFILAIERVRDKIRNSIDTLLPDATGAVLKALVIGEAPSVPDEVRERFSRLGIAHLLAISGLHIGIVALISYRAILWLLRRSARILLMGEAAKLAALLSSVPVILYCCVAGFTIPTIRATIMVMCYLAALLLGRPHDLMHTLFVAAFIILLVLPTSLFDVSFLLSFSAVFWILLLVPAWQRSFPRTEHKLFTQPHPVLQRYRTVLRDTCLASGSALLGTAPIVAVFFHYFSCVGFIANLVVVPLAGFAIVPAGLLGAMLSLLNENLARLLLIPAGWLTNVLLTMVEFYANIPGIALPVAVPSFFQITGFYGLLWLSAVLLPRRRTILFLAAVLLFGIAQGISTFASTRHSDLLTVTFLDVGAGDATVVEFPDRSVMVIDGAGSYNDQFDPGASIIAPFLYSRGITKVDYLVLTHPHRDHAAGLATIAKVFKPRELWYNGEPSPIEPVQKLFDVTQKKRIVLIFCSRQSASRLIGNVRIDFLNPPESTSFVFPRSNADTNNDSLVMKITYGTTSFLMAGDILQEREQRLVQEKAPLSATVLKVPHHGGKTSSSTGFVQAVKPNISIASCTTSELAPEIAQRYHNQGALLLTTARNGAITITTDGTTYHVKTFQ